jgi:hypothetical protein
MVNSLTAKMAPSGKSLVLDFFDGSGSPTNLISVASSDETQRITLSGIPAGGTFTLSLDGQVTAAIAAGGIPPVVSGLWTFPTVAGHSYRVGVAFNNNSYVATQLMFELLDAGRVVQSMTTPGAAGQGTAPATYVDGTLTPTGASLPVKWIDFPAYRVASGTALSIQVSASTDGSLQQDAIRVEDLTVPSVAHYDDQQVIGATPAYAASGSSALTGQPQTYLGTVTSSPGSGSGLGERYVATGGAEAIRAALAALPNVRPAGVSVADQSGQGTGSYLVSFTGPLASTPQSLMVSSSPTLVAVSRVTLGGTAPVLSINGGAGLHLTDVLTYPQPYRSCLLPIPQPSRRITTRIVNQEGVTVNGYWSASRSQASLSGSSFFTNGPGLTCTFTFTSLTPGTYQLAAYWPTDVGDYFGTTYTPAPAVTFTIKDAAGAVVSTTAIDQRTAPADYTDLGYGWKRIGPALNATVFNAGYSLTIDSNLLTAGGPVIAIADAVQLRRTSADPITAAGPSDSLTLSWPSGFFVTAAGPVPAGSGLAVAPPSPTAIIPAFGNTAKTARMGYNVSPGNAYSFIMTYANLAYQADWTFGKTPGNPGAVRARDAAGYPTRLSVARTYGFVGGAYLQAGLPHYNAPFPNGKYTLLWDGAGTACELTQDGGTKTNLAEIVSLRSLTGTTDNRRVYDIRAQTGYYSPFFSLTLNGGTVDGATGWYPVNATNVRIIPPDPADATGNTPWTGTIPRWHQSFLAKLAGSACLRFMDSLGTILNTRTGLSGFKPQANPDRSGFLSSAKFAITRIGEPLVARFLHPFMKVIQVTTATDHDFSQFGTITFTGAPSITFADGGLLDLADITLYVAKVIDARNLLVIVNEGGSATTVSNVVSGGTVSSDFRGTYLSIADIVSMVAAASVPEIWWNVPQSGDLSVGGDMDAEADYLAANLPAGCKVHVEWGNECWNIGGPQFNICRAMEKTLFAPIDSFAYENYYADRQKLAHDRFQARFTAAGRPNDIIYTYGSNAQKPFQTTNILNRAKANGARVDEVAIANYFSNSHRGGLGPNGDAIGRRMDADQHLDCLEYNVEHGEWDKYFSDHKAAAVAAGYPNAKITTYEASLQVALHQDAGYSQIPPNGFPNFYPTYNAVKHHPRMYGIFLREFQKCQDAGMDLWLHYLLAGGDTGVAWDAWDYSAQQPGTGNASLDPVNVSDPTDYSQVKSQPGGAIQHWASLVGVVIAAPTGLLAILIRRLLAARSRRRHVTPRTWRR